MAEIAFVQRVTRRLRHTFIPPRSPKLYLVRSPRLLDEWLRGPKGDELYSSSFNPAWFSELGVEPSTIVDVGSYDGGDAYRLHQAFPAARVVTIEADASRAVLVRKALAGTPIEVIECAVLEEDREVEFYPTTIDGEPSSQGSLFRFTAKSAKELAHIKQASDPVVVVGRSLSSLLSERGLDEISLLHMDIQGAEYGALVGLGEYRPQLVYLEVGAHYRGIKGPRDVHRKLTAMGYRLAADFITDRLYTR